MSRPAGLSTARYSSPKATAAQPLFWCDAYQTLLLTCSRKVLTVVSRRDSSFSCSKRMSSYTPCMCALST